MKPFVRLTLIAALLFAAGPLGAMPSVVPSATSDDYKLGEVAVAAGRYLEAIERFTKIVQRQPENADAHNLLGFSYRKSGNMDRAQAHYRTALQINPKHLGALEYYGELFVELKDLPRAQEQLAKLSEACPNGCEQRTALEKAVSGLKSGS